ncbi:hypothetical protein ACOMHN_004011 [Nucella lapillus]
MQNHRHNWHRTVNSGGKGMGVGWEGETGAEFPPNLYPTLIALSSGERSDRLKVAAACDKLETWRCCVSEEGVDAETLPSSSASFLHGWHPTRGLHETDDCCQRK